MGPWYTNFVAKKRKRASLDVCCKNEGRHDGERGEKLPVKKKRSQVGTAKGGEKGERVRNAGGGGRGGNSYHLTETKKGRADCG